MDDYTKNIKISFDIDKSSYDVVVRKIKDIAQNVDFSFSDKQMRVFQEFLETLEKSKIDMSEDAKHIVKDIIDNNVQIGIDKKSFADVTDKITEANNTMGRQFRQNIERATKNYAIMAKKGYITKEQQEKYGDIYSTEQKIEEAIEKHLEMIKDLKQIGSNVSDETIKSIEKQVEALEKERAVITGDEIRILTDSQKKEAEMIQMREKLMQKFGDIVSEALDKLKEVFSDAWEEMSSMLQYTNDTKPLAANAQKYAYEKTMDFMGLSSSSEIYELDKKGLAKFQEKFIEYTDRYEQLYDEGFFDQLQEYNWEIEEFKQDIQSSIIQFYVDNKDIIKVAMQSIIKLADFVVDKFGILLRNITGSERSASERAAATSEIIHRTENKNTNIKMDTTYNLTYDDIGKPHTEQIINSSQFIWEQILSALN